MESIGVPIASGSAAPTSERLDQTDLPERTVDVNEPRPMNTELIGEAWRLRTATRFGG